MIKHMFKIIWNRRKRNALMTTGIFFSFLILFAFFTIVLTAWENYREPLGFETENLWRLTIDWKDSDRDQVATALKQLESALSAVDEVESWTFSDTILFNRGAMFYHYEWNGMNLGFPGFRTDDAYGEIMGLSLSEGRWFGAEDDGRGYIPIVITGRIKEIYFPDEAFEDIVLQDDRNKYRVVGIVDVFRKEGNLAAPAEMVFLRHEGIDEEWIRFSPVANYILRLDGDSGFLPEEKMIGLLSSLAPGWDLKLDSLEEERRKSVRDEIRGPLILLVLGVFLLINVALGLFGVIWYNTGKRYPEIGLRRAMGSTAQDIARLIIGETVTLASFSIMLASFFAVQAPLLGVFGNVSPGIYGQSWIMAALFIYLTAVVCALYPAWLASGKEPAAALHYE